MPSSHLGLILAIMMIPLSAACQQAPLVSDVTVDVPVISPNGDGVDDETTIGYSIGRESLVSIVLKDQSGKDYLFREKEPRSPGRFSAEFDAVTAVDDGKATRRVMPDGEYQFTITAEDLSGRKGDASGTITIKGGDRQPVLVENMAASLAGGRTAQGGGSPAISPNGDGIDDEVLITYGISKDSEVVIFAKDSQDRVTQLERRELKKAGLYSHYWNGTSGGRVLPDGLYQIHVQAFDKSGNVSEDIKQVRLQGSGRPELRITRVDFSPTALAIGNNLEVSIRVKNVGDTAVRTLGPAPGTPYRTDMTYNFWLEDDNATPKYFERPGTWRVAVSWNLAGSPYPVRWGLFADTNRQLLPGEETVVTGTIAVLPRTRELRFWAAIEQGGVGFPGGEVGLKTIIVDY